VAEEVKKRHGYARTEGVDPSEVVEVAMFGEDSQQAVSRQFIAQVLEARAEEIFELILQEVKRSGYDGLLPAGVVLCGGSAKLAGMRELGREIMQLPVRIGAPTDLRGLVDTISSPAYAASVGLLWWGLRHGPPPPKPKRGGLLGRLLEWLKIFLPG